MHLLFLIGVCPSVCLWEASELRSGQHLTIPSDFFPMFCPELLRRFWSDQSETYTDWIYMGWSCTPPLGAMSVRPFVCERCRNLGPHSILLIPSVFFQCSLLNLSWGFSRINLKPIQIEYIWVGVVHLPLRAASHRPFFCERGRNLAPTAF